MTFGTHFQHAVQRRRTCQAASPVPRSSIDAGSGVGAGEDGPSDTITSFREEKRPPPKSSAVTEIVPAPVNDSVNSGDEPAACEKRLTTPVRVTGALSV